MRAFGAGDSPEGMMMSLREIASWPPFAGTPGEMPLIVAGVPSLQRGLVWRAGQVELMWDSLARGFPIGSLVVCPKLSGLQKTRNAAGTDEDLVTHHLLDGQQRAQALHLGFVDPIASRSEVTLWLDLAPGKPGGTRAFRFRVTTKAHPWGYSADDSAGRLPVEKVRTSLELCGIKPLSRNFEERPEPFSCWPMEAVAPVPLAWLMKAEDDSDDRLAAAVNAQCRALAGTEPHSHWTTAVQKTLADPAARPRLEAVWNAVRRLRRTMIAVVAVPQAVLSEAADEQGATSAVAIAETMFQRLNRGGTALDGDELAYSMVKAHWPQIEESVEAVAEQRKLPEARLVTLAARLPMGDETDAAGTVSSRISVDAIRRLAVVPASAEINESSGRLRVRERFEGFFLGGDQVGLKQVLDRVGDFCPADAEYSLPVVLQTTLARSSPDVYALMLWIADLSIREDDAYASPGYARRVQGLLTSLAWFSPEPRNAAAVVAAALARRGLSGDDSFAGILKEAKEANKYAVRLPPTMEEIQNLVPEPDGGPGDWRLWHRLNGTEEVKDSVRRIVNNKDLLLYAQRLLLRQEFPNYDPSRRDLWADYDRPWDIDHILASDSVNYRSNLTGVSKTALWDWSKGNIANLRAWPFAHNRRDGATAPSLKFDKANLPVGMGADEAMRLSFLSAGEKTGMEEGFKYARQDGGEESLRAFVTGARDRLLRIYHEWYGADGLDIGYLTGQAG